MKNTEQKRYVVNIPEDYLNHSTDVFVSIGDRNWKIQRGVDVEVPECVALLLEDQKRALKAKEINIRKQAEKNRR